MIGNPKICRSEIGNVATVTKRYGGKNTFAWMRGPKTEAEAPHVWREGERVLSYGGGWRFHFSHHPLFSLTFDNNLALFLVEEEENCSFHRQSHPPKRRFTNTWPNRRTLRLPSPSPIDIRRTTRQAHTPQTRALRQSLRRQSIIDQQSPPQRPAMPPSARGAFAPADDVVGRLLAGRAAAERNAAVLDSMSVASAAPPPHGGPPSGEPISKHLLGALFGALAHVDGDNGRYLYVPNEHGSHFLYGLVVPLLARMLAASCPGLCVVVQLPGEAEGGRKVGEVVEDDEAGGSGSGSGSGMGSSGRGSSERGSSGRGSSGRGSSRDLSRAGSGTASGSGKAPSTTAYPNGATPSDSTPSPPGGVGSDGGEVDRSEVIRKGSQGGGGGGGGGAYSRSYGDERNKTVRLMCNGFEVLTGKMPDKPVNGENGHVEGADGENDKYTLATVCWEKAGIVTPVRADVSVEMMFSNGMMSVTEGVVVSFTNGSICQLTIRDPVGAVKALQVAERASTPVLLFSFTRKGDKPVTSLAKRNSNLFVVEIGYGAPDGDVKMGGTDGESEESGANGNFPSESPRPRPRSRKSTTGSSNGKKMLGLNDEEVHVRDTVKTLTEATAGDPSARSSIPLECIPNCVPLFVNTVVSGRDLANKSPSAKDAPAAHEVGSGKQGPTAEAVISAAKSAHTPLILGSGTKRKLPQLPRQIQNRRIDRAAQFSLPIVPNSYHSVHYPQRQDGREEGRGDVTVPTLPHSQQQYQPGHHPVGAPMYHHPVYFYGQPNMHPPPPPGAYGAMYPSGYHGHSMKAGQHPHLPSNAPMYHGHPHHPQYMYSHPPPYHQAPQQHPHHGGMPVQHPHSRPMPYSTYPSDYPVDGKGKPQSPSKTKPLHALEINDASMDASPLPSRPAAAKDHVGRIRGSGRGGTGGGGMAHPKKRSRPALDSPNMQALADAAAAAPKRSSHPSPFQSKYSHRGRTSSTKSSDSRDALEALVGMRCDSGVGYRAGNSRQVGAVDGTDRYDGDDDRHNGSGESNDADGGGEIQQVTNGIHGRAARWRSTEDGGGNSSGNSSFTSGLLDASEAGSQPQRKRSRR